MMPAGAVLAALDRLPDAGIETILGGGRPMILAPHPDDESLGCGGLIAECCRRGQAPVVVILTDGAASHPDSRQYPPERLRRVRAGEARAAVARLGLAPEHLLFLDYPDTALPATQAVTARIAALARGQGCTVLLGPWLHDPHCDHEAAAIIARNAAGAARCRLLSYPVWGWLLPPEQELPLDQIIGWRLDIAAHLTAKRSAIAAHASQYSDLIGDSPAGFRLPHDLLAVFERPYEVFIAQ